VITRVTIAVLALAACTRPSSRALPGASYTPHLRASVATRACGEDVAYDGHSSPDETYSYSYDDFGRLAGAIGSYPYGGDDETTAYAYDNLDHETHMLDTLPSGGGTIEIVADYDTLGDLVDYTYATTIPNSVDTQRYTMSQFTATGQPTIEVISDTSAPDAHYTLAYDAASRIVLAVRDGTSSTTYSYDDDGRTVTIDTDSGAFTGTIIYDDDNHELSETWGGSDPSAIASQTTYDYDGGQLLDVTYESGTPLAVIEVDTLRYCAR